MPSGEFLLTVCYDIADDGRRRKASRILADYGTRVQWSVFECLVNEKHCRELRRRLHEALTDQDSVRYYRLCASCAKRIEAEGKGSDLGPEEVPPVIVV